MKEEFRKIKAKNAKVIAPEYVAQGYAIGTDTGSITGTLEYPVEHTYTEDGMLSALPESIRKYLEDKIDTAVSKLPQKGTDPAQEELTPTEISEMLQELDDAITQHIENNTLGETGESDKEAQEQPQTPPETPKTPQ